MSAETKVLLFDIDLTLLWAGGAGTRAVNRTFEELYGIQDAFRGVRPDGKTDPLIFREIFERRLPHLSPDGEMSRAAERYLIHVEEELARATDFRLMPGVERLLVALSELPAIALGVATGNLEGSAWLKLKRGGLDTYFRFGGFGSDAEERSELIRAAVGRAERVLGQRLSGDQVFVIGDTPFDIEHAKKAGMRSVGVATGRTTMQELADCGAEHLFEDFTRTGDVVGYFLRSVR